MQHSPNRERELEQTLHQRFEQVAARQPEKTAIQARSESATYGEVNRLANRLARAILQKQDAGPEAVAIVLGQRIVAAAAMLGILKSGNFYVPLSSGDPAARMALMLSDSGARLIVTDAEQLPPARALAADGRQVLCLDELPGDSPDDNLDRDVSPDALSYLLYTSGSTGIPKGVMQSHRATMHTILRQMDRNAYTWGRSAVFSSLSVQGPVAPVFAALLDGGTICLYDVQREGVDGMADFLRRESIQSFRCTPTIFRLFVAQQDGPLALPALRRIELAGETVTPRDVELFKRTFARPCILRNSFGTTESRGATEQLITHDTVISGGVVPAGRALSGVELHVRDEQGRDVPAGEIGEIVVRCAFMALGYWKRPDLTAAAFLADPEGGNRRLYRTGDLGRLRADGVLEHLGRKDFQIKIRGQRVEIGELESALLNDEAVQAGAVMARDSGQGEKRLVAYIMPRPGHATSDAALLRRLQQQVPVYALPTSIVRVAALPLTASGKVDYQTLQAMEAPSLKAVTEYAAPRSPVEAEVAAIWAAVLGVPEVGMHDEFLMLGGHSLQAAQIVARVLKAFQVELPPERLLGSDTAGAMAAAVGAELARQTAPAQLAQILDRLDALSEDEARALFGTALF